MYLSLIFYYLPLFMKNNISIAYESNSKLIGLLLLLI